MDSPLREVNIHITDKCSANCQYCYYRVGERVWEPKDGDLETLKKIVHNAIVCGEVERFIMVGGDPCEHPHLVELLKYIKEEGKKYNVKTKTIVLSNTHEYKENGKVVDISEVAPYIDEMDVTIHGATAEDHDRESNCKGSYNKVINNMKKFCQVKTSEQKISAVINAIPYTAEHINEILLSTAMVFEGQLDSFQIQRIAPQGRAKGDFQFFLEKAEANKIMQALYEIKENADYPIDQIDFVDVFPYCAIKKEYRGLLPTGGEIWGIETVSVNYDGSVKRNAMSTSDLSKNFLELDTPAKFEDFWYNDPELRAFRDKLHIDDKCRSCELCTDEACGGGESLARKWSDPDPFTDLKNIRRGHDYLANPPVGNSEGEGRE